MKHIKIAAGLAHVNYGNIADVVKQASDAGVDYIHSDAADMYDLQLPTNRSKYTFTQETWTSCSSIRCMTPEQTC